MKYERIPPCPRSKNLQYFLYILVFVALVLGPGLLMYVGIGAIADKGTVLHTVLAGASSIFCLIVAVKAISSMEKKYDDQCYAWVVYWDEYWQHVHDLEVQIRDLPSSAPDHERQRLQLELATMHSIRERYLSSH